MLFFPDQVCSVYLLSNTFTVTKAVNFSQIYRRIGRINIFLMGSVNQLIWYWHIMYADRRNKFAKQKAPHECGAMGDWFSILGRSIEASSSRAVRLFLEL